MAVKVTSRGGHVTLFKRKMAADTKWVVNDQLFPEDDFDGLYYSDAHASNIVLEPRYNPYTLYALVTRNNILAQCIAAMEVNVDGTGYDLAPIDEEEEKKKKEKEKKNRGGKGSELVEKEEDDPEKKNLKAFFDQPYLDMSFTVMRRLLRIDLEATGNAYLEVIENLKKEIIFFRWLDATRMRLVKLDKEVLVPKTITRNGKDFTADMWMRERRFVQKIGQDLVYYKEFGASRDLHRRKGEWITKENAPNLGTVEAKDYATSVIHFTLDREPKNNYGIPRWINQLPSILGSRKAEEFNLEFFDSGGIPPAVVFIQGGSLADDVRQQLNAIFQGNTKSKHRGAVVEVQSSSGSLDSVGKVDVKTERFGGTRTNDAMFQEYDANTEMHVRVAFRLPPIFLGKAEDYSFASAMTSYMVAEAQVFAPERTEFDEIINTKVMTALGAKKYKFVSKPITLKNVEVQLKGIELVQDVVDGEQMVDTVNDITGMHLEFSQEAVDQKQQMQMQLLQAKAVPPGGEGKAPPGGNPKPGAGQKPGLRAVKNDSAIGALELIQLAGDWAVATGLEVRNPEDNRDLDAKEIAQKIDALTEEDRQVFDKVFLQKTIANSSLDSAGLGEIAACASSCLMH